MADAPTIEADVDSTETAPIVDGEIVDAAGSAEAELLEADLLVEDVSIDGMCGVY